MTRVAAMLAIIALGACGGRAAPSPATSAPPVERIQVFYARPGDPPLAAPIFVVTGLGVEARLRARFDALAAAPSVLPDMSINMLRDAPPITRISVDRDLAILDFKVANGNWGLHDSSSVHAFVEQVVFTATDERSVYKVRLTESGGEDPVIGVEDMIVTYTAPLTREMVAPNVRPDHTVVYFARDGNTPLAVFLEGAGETAEERIASRLLALQRGPAAIGEAFNVAAAMKARLASVTVNGDLVIIDYRVPLDDWGVDGSTRARRLVQQLVYTATEEPGITRVLITQNGAAGAVIGGEGLIVDRPQTRRGLGD